MMIQTGISHGSESAAETSPTRARFVLLTDLPPTVARAEVVRTPTRVSWNLISANNRPLGRAATMFGSLELCLAETEALRLGADRVDGSIAHRDQTEDRRPYWTWSVQLDDRAVAIAASRYARRFECAGSLERFLIALPLASAAAPTVLRVGRRLREGSP